MVKAAHSSMRSMKVVTSFGEVEIDERGHADVPEGMAEKIKAGDYGPDWGLLGAKKASKKAAKDEKKESFVDKAKKKLSKKKKTKKR